MVEWVSKRERKRLFKWHHEAKEEKNWLERVKEHCTQLNCLFGWLRKPLHYILQWNCFVWLYFHQWWREALKIIILACFLSRYILPHSHCWAAFDWSILFRASMTYVKKKLLQTYTRKMMSNTDLAQCVFHFRLSFVALCLNVFSLLFFLAIQWTTMNEKLSLSVSSLFNDINIADYSKGNEFHHTHIILSFYLSARYRFWDSNRIGTLTMYLWNFFLSFISSKELRAI